jgi:hypothetical protein
VISEFCNEPIPGQGIENLDDVNAQLFYYGIRDNQLKHRIQKGIWLGEDSGVWLNVADSQKLLLGLYDPNSDRELIAVDNGSSSIGHHQKRIDLSDGLHVRIRLVDASQWVRIFGFDLLLSKEIIQIVYKGFFDSIAPYTS